MLNLSAMLSYLGSKSHLWISIFGLFLILSVVVVDYLKVPTHSFLLFYLIPIVGISWFGGRNLGLTAALFASLPWFSVRVILLHEDSDTFVLYWDFFMRLLSFLFIAYIVSAFRLSLKRQKELARTDALTQIFNRLYFYELLNMEVKRAVRYGWTFALVYIDVDNFKYINDHYGHTKGDALLRLIAQTLQKSIRSTDFAARLGGDEFAVLLPKTEPDSCKIAIEKVHRQLLNEVRVNKYPVTFSVGSMTFFDVPETIEDIVKIADTLMYSVKNNGKNNVIYDVWSNASERSIESLNKT